MFDWFWEFLYQISRLLFWASDLMMDAALLLCGIKPVTFDGESTDFISYLINSDDIQWAYAAIVIIAVCALFVMTLIAILMSLAKAGETNSKTPAQIGMIAAKNLLMFIFVPAVLICFTAIMNTFMYAVYRATLRGGSSVGSYLFVVFARDAGLSDADKIRFLNQDLSYNTMSDVTNAITLKNFQFILSWIVGAVVLYYLSSTLIQFVDRAIEIVILFLAAPFCMASSVLDEGSRFKTWKDQIISKYLGAFGAIVAINIYCLVCSAIVDSKFEFSSIGIINDCAKVLVILGGAFTMKKAMVLVATLVSQTAAADQNDPAFKGNAFGAALGKAAGFAAKATGLSAIGKGISNKVGEKFGDLGRGIRGKLGLKTTEDRQHEKQMRDLDKSEKEDQGNTDSKNDNQPDYNKDDSLNNALNGGEEDKKDDNNENDKKPDSQGNNMLNNALNGGNEKKDDKKEEGE